MNTAMRVIFACISVVAAVFAILFLIGILHWVLIVGAFVGVGYLIFQLGASSRPALDGTNRSMRKLERELKKLSKRDP